MVVAGTEVLFRRQNSPAIPSLSEWLVMAAAPCRCSTLDVSFIALGVAMAIRAYAELPSVPTVVSQYLLPRARVNVALTVAISSLRRVMTQRSRPQVKSRAVARRF